MYWLTGLLGLALVVAPFALGYSGDPTALWSSIILGTVVALVSAYLSVTRNVANWVHWVLGPAGLLAVIAPLVLGFSDQATVMWTSIVLGALVAIPAGYQCFFAQPKAG
jgi:hypothetical protein